MLRKLRLRHFGVCFPDGNGTVVWDLLLLGHWYPIERTWHGAGSLFP